MTFLKPLVRLIAFASYVLGLPTLAPPQPGLATQGLNCDWYVANELFNLTRNIQPAPRELLRPNHNLNPTVPSQPAANLTRETDIGTTICHNLPLAHSGAIEQNIAYLDGMKRTAVAAPKTCARVACSHNAAIWWCNASDKEITVLGWKHIAAGARILVDNCALKGPKKPSVWLWGDDAVSGMRVYPDNTVIMIQDDWGTKAGGCW